MAPRRRRIPLRLALPLIVVVFIVTVGATAAFQPRVANHFGYALPGKDGLPTYIYANGRRYQSLQVCAGADWCQQDRLQALIPRCYTQADLQALHIWPLKPVSTMFTLVWRAAADSGAHWPRRPDAPLRHGRRPELLRHLFAGRRAVAPQPRYG